MRKLNLYKEMPIWRDYNCSRHPDRNAVEFYDTGEARCVKCVAQAEEQ